MTMSSASPFENRGKDVSNFDDTQKQSDEYSLTDATNSLLLSPPAMVSERNSRANRLTKYHKGLSNLNRSPLSRPQRVQNRRNIPAFLNKLFNMVDDQSTESLIRWSLNGDSFLVENHEEFAQSVLPRFFKHNTFSSFVRQLNMYDFHKVPVIQQGALATDPKREIWEFKHSNFQRGRQELLASVTRKRNKDKDQPNNKQIDLPTLIGDMSAIKQRQSDIMESLHTIRTDNERIWKEALDLRKKYKRQQDITIKVLQFLSLQFRGHHTHLQDTLLDLQNSIEPQEREEKSEGLGTIKNGLAIEPSDIIDTGIKDLETTSISITENAGQRDATMNYMYIDQRHTLYSNMFDSASKAAHNFTQNMGQLWTNVESLASQICLDSPEPESSITKDKDNFDFLKIPPKQANAQQLNLEDNSTEPMFHNNDNPFVILTSSDSHVPMAKVVTDQPSVKPCINLNFVNLPLESGTMAQLPNMLMESSNTILDETPKKDEHRYKKNTQNKLFFMNHRPSTVFYK